MYKKKCGIIVLLLMIIQINSAFGGTFSTDKWSHAPRDIYFHVGGSTACTSLLGLSYKSKAIHQGSEDNNQLNFDASWKSALVCNALGLIKEFGFDSKPSLRESLFNLAGSIIGVGIVYTW